MINLMNITKISPVICVAHLTPHTSAADVWGTLGARPGARPTPPHITRSWGQRILIKKNDIYYSTDTRWGHRAAGNTYSGSVDPTIFGTKGQMDTGISLSLNQETWIQPGPDDPLSLCMPL